jgi:hypothetical protein
MAPIPGSVCRVAGDDFSDLAEAASWRKTEEVARAESA